MRCRCVLARPRLAGREAIGEKAKKVLNDPKNVVAERYPFDGRLADRRLYSGFWIESNVYQHTG